MKIWSRILGQVAAKPQELIFGIILGALAMVLIVIGIVILNGYDFNKEEANSPASQASSPAPEFKAIKSRESLGATRSDTLSTDLMEKNSSGITGTVLFVQFAELKDQVFIGLEIRGRLEQTSYPAYIHEGSCDKPGRQLYSLSSVANGKTENYLSSSLADFRKQFPLALRVQRVVSQDISNDIACADLK